MFGPTQAALFKSAQAQTFGIIEARFEAMTTYFFKLYLTESVAQFRSRPVGRQGYRTIYGQKIV